MCRSIVDIQSATAEIRGGEKNKKKKETTVAKYYVHNPHLLRIITIVN